MATVTSLTAARMLASEANTIISGEVVGDDLILEKQGGSTVNAGNVRGPEGDAGPTGDEGPQGPRGTQIFTVDEDVTNISEVPGAIVGDLIINKGDTVILILTETAQPGYAIRVETSTTGSYDGNYKGPMGEQGPVGSPTVYTDFDSFPATPDEGDLAVLQTSVMEGSGVAWVFRYMAGVTGAEKWVFQGGARLETGVLGSRTIATADTMYALTSGPAILVPATGKYYVGITGTINSGADNLTAGRLSVRESSSDPAVAELVFSSIIEGHGGRATCVGAQVNLTEGDILSCFCWNDDTAACTYSDAQITLEPVRLGS